MNKFCQMLESFYFETETWSYEQKINNFFSLSHPDALLPKFGTYWFNMNHMCIRWRQRYSVGTLKSTEFFSQP